MLDRRVFSQHHRLLIAFSLVFGSLLSTSMVGARYLYSGRTTFAFMVWNLFLAWLPLCFAALAYHSFSKGERFRVSTVAWGFLWMLFLPNAPYMVTDLMHLRRTGHAPFWFDLIMLLSFGLMGLLLGYISLYLMQDVVTRSRGAITGWAFAICVLGLSAFGIYLGRYLRWNSWDVFLNPHGILQDIAVRFLYPHHYPRTFAMSLLLSVMLTFIYLVLFGLARLGRDPLDAVSRKPS